MKYVGMVICGLAALWCGAEPCFRPGQIWPDDKGVHINAHGGGVLFHEGTYYWFGEHKIEGKAGNAAHVGVHVYVSTNLYSWLDKGIALRVSSEPGNDIEDGCVIERPKVLLCPKTGKFVMFFHLELKGNGYKAAKTGLAVSDTVLGPYRFLRSLRPNGQMSRDMTLFQDDDGHAYHIFASEENRTMQIAELTDNYLDYTGKYMRILEKTSTEAPAIFKHKGVYYLIGSGCTGWAPNQARLFKASTLVGPWESLGNPCKGVNPQNQLGPEKTWGGQSTFFLPVAGRPDTVIAMFDIWCPQNAIDGRYIWLPVTFDKGSLSIVWQDEWSL